MDTRALLLQRWWIETWRRLDINPSDVRSLRAVGDSITASRLGPLVESELAILGANSASGSELHGRLGLAGLLQLAHEVTPTSFGPLVKAIVGQRAPLDFETVGTLATALRDVVAGCNAAVGGALEAALAALQGGFAALGSEGGEPDMKATQDARRRQAEAILAYKNASTNLHQLRAGLIAMAHWASDPHLRTRLERLGGPLTPAQVHRDLCALGVLVALQIRPRLAQLGRWLPVPDPRAMDTRQAIIERALSALAPIASEPQRPVPRPPTASMSAAPPARPVVSPGPTLAPPAPPESRTPPSPREEWLEAARIWAEGRPEALRHLFESEGRLEKCRLWSELAKDVARLPVGHSLRPQETARYAFACLLDEFRRAFPEDYCEFLELVTVEPGEILRAAHVGDLWEMLEPLFRGWARELAPGAGELAQGEIIRTLHRQGDILPWDDEVKGSDEKRREAQDAAIELVYGPRGGGARPDQVRKAIFWCAIWARNDGVHRNPDRLAGRIRPLELLTDVVALAALASIRYRIRIAEIGRTQASVPSLYGVASALVNETKLNTR